MPNKSLFFVPGLGRDLRRLKFDNYPIGPVGKLNINKEREGRLDRLGSGWLPHGYKKLSGFLRELSQLKVLERKTKREENHSRLGVSDSLTRLPDF